ncbi:hypothetical protein, partial [uncultured Duodenibacillus sp.]
MFQQHSGLFLFMRQAPFLLLDSLYRRRPSFQAEQALPVHRNSARKPASSDAGGIAAVFILKNW